MSHQHAIGPMAMANGLGTHFCLEKRPVAGRGPARRPARIPGRGRQHRRDLGQDGSRLLLGIQHHRKAAHSLDHRGDIGRVELLAGQRQVSFPTPGCLRCAITSGRHRMLSPAADFGGEFRRRSPAAPAAGGQVTPSRPHEALGPNGSHGRKLRVRCCTRLVKYLRADVWKLGSTGMRQQRPRRRVHPPAKSPGLYLPRNNGEARRRGSGIGGRRGHGLAPFTCWFLKPLRRLVMLVGAVAGDKRDGQVSGRRVFFETSGGAVGYSGPGNHSPRIWGRQYRAKRAHPASRKAP